MYIVWITTCARCAQIQTNAFVLLRCPQVLIDFSPQDVVEMFFQLYIWVALLFLVMIRHVYVLLVTKVNFYPFVVIHELFNSKLVISRVLKLINMLLESTY
jgi:hypothetical protein